MTENYIKPEDVSSEAAQKILDFLNSAQSSEEIASTVEIPQERDVGIIVAQHILDRRKELGKFTNLQQVADVTQVGPERFTEIVKTLGQVEISVIPYTEDDNFQGLMWNKHPSGLYFDIYEPTILWIHGWPDYNHMSYHRNFLYAAECLSKGYNVGIYRWQKDGIDIARTYVPYWTWAAPADPTCRRVFMSQIWKPGGSIHTFIEASFSFFGQESLRNSYNKEITILAHSAGAQLAVMGFWSFHVGKDALNNYKFRLVLADPWVPCPYGLFTDAYDLPTCRLILSKFLDLGNRLFFINTTPYAGGITIDTLLKYCGKYYSGGRAEGLMQTQCLACPREKQKFDLSSRTGVTYKSFGYAFPDINWQLSRYNRMYHDAYGWEGELAEKWGCYHHAATDWYCHKILKVYEP